MADHGREQSGKARYSAEKIWACLGHLLGHVLGIVWGMSGTSSRTCLGHHLGHVSGIIWGIIEGMSVTTPGACLEHHLGHHLEHIVNNGQQSAVLQASVMPF